MDREAWWATVHGLQRVDMTKQLSLMILVWFPWWLSGKEPASIAGDAGGVDLFPGLGRSLEEEMTISGGKMAILVGGNGNPLQCSCLENPIESQRAGHN